MRRDTRPTTRAPRSAGRATRRLALLDGNAESPTTSPDVSVEIISVGSSRDLRRFIDLPWKIYNAADHPQWVPPLRIAVRDALDTKAQSVLPHGRPTALSRAPRRTTGRPHRRDRESCAQRVPRRSRRVLRVLRVHRRSRSRRERALRRRRNMAGRARPRHHARPDESVHQSRMRHARRRLRCSIR